MVSFTISSLVKKVLNGSFLNLDVVSLKLVV